MKRSSETIMPRSGYSTGAHLKSSVTRMSSVENLTPRCGYSLPDDCTFLQSQIVHPTISSFLQRDTGWPRIDTVCIVLFLFSSTITTIFYPPPQIIFSRQKALITLSWSFWVVCFLLFRVSFLSFLLSLIATSFSPLGQETHGHL